MIKKKLFVIFLISLLIININAVENIYKFGLIVIPASTDILIPDYLKPNFLLSKLKWLTKLNLSDAQLEKIKQINKNSINLLNDMINLDFLFLLEYYSENNDIIIHIYSLFHKIYCGNSVLRLENSDITLSFLNLIYNLMNKLSLNYEKNEFQNIVDITLKRFTYESNGKILYMIPSKVIFESLYFLLYLNYSNDSNFKIYLEKTRLNKEFSKEEKITTIKLFNLIEKIIKTIINYNLMDEIVINGITYKIIKDNHIKNAITILLKTKLSKTEYEVLSFFLLN
ncbi:MAG: hypothetical protein ACK4YF_06330 [Exilispira sp.]